MRRSTVDKAAEDSRTQNLAKLGAENDARQRLGVRLSSAAFVLEIVWAPFRNSALGFMKRRITDSVFLFTSVCASVQNSKEKAIRKRRRACPEEHPRQKLAGSERKLDGFRRSSRTARRSRERNWRGTRAMGAGWPRLAFAMRAKPVIRE